MQKVFYTGIISLIFCLSLQAEEKRLDGIAAVIGDEIILQSEIDAYTMMRLKDMKVNLDSIDLSKYRKQFLNELIDGKVLLVHAKNDSTISIRDQEVEQALDNHIRMLEQQNNLTPEQLKAEILRQQGMSLSKFKSEARKAIREQLLKQKVQQSYLYGIKVTRKEVTDFYNEYKDSLPSVGESVLLSKLSLQLKPSEDLRQAAYEKITSIKQRLDNGEKFEDLAKKFSEGPEAENGGDLGFIAKGSLNELTFEEKAFGLAPGQISEPFQTRLGFHIIQVLAKREQKAHIRQIFIKVAPSEKEIESVKNRLDSIASACKTQKEFESAVKKFSCDEPSKIRDGNIGWVSLLALPAGVRTAVDSLDKGSITKPVRDDNNIYSIYRIDERVANRSLTLENDYGILETKAKDILAQKKLKNLVSQWRKNLYIDIRI